MKIGFKVVLSIMNWEALKPLRKVLRDDLVISVKLL